MTIERYITCICQSSEHYITCICQSSERYITCICQSSEHYITCICQSSERYPLFISVSGMYLHRAVHTEIVQTSRTGSTPTWRLNVPLSTSVQMASSWVIHCVLLVSIGCPTRISWSMFHAEPHFVSLL